MARTVTLTQLKARALQRLGLENDASITSAELDSYIQDSATGLYDLLVQARGESYYLAEATASTTANVDTISTAGGAGQLPATIMRVIAVYWEPSATERPILLLPYEERESESLWTTGGWSTGDPPHYRRLIAGAKIQFVPKPTAVHAIRLRYIPACPTIGDASPAPLDGVDGWDEYVVLDTMIKLAVKDQTIDPGPMMQQLGAVRERIVGMSSDVEHIQPQRIQRVRRSAWWSSDDERRARFMARWPR